MGLYWKVDFQLHLFQQNQFPEEIKMIIAADGLQNADTQPS